MAFALDLRASLKMGILELRRQSDRTLESTSVGRDIRLLLTW